MTAKELHLLVEGKFTPFEDEESEVSGSVLM